ncbi:glucans biosynthesis glucosyltransferase MdoH [Plastorhodobacter daqingensis]|uniref:Glucans biosynthesis glucosyltransferase H n=1 Tax=Plastorhodobacter daqingensis TaxID=1387281 RepID=A0ABW2UHT2_9RHOB
MRPRDGLSLLAVRLAALLPTLGLGIGAALLFLQFGAADGLDRLDILRAGLIGISTLWLAWGAMQGLLGLLAVHLEGLPPVGSDAPIRGRTAILVPVCNEDPAETLSRVAAIDLSLDALGLSQQFHFAILSDTRNEEVARQEEIWFARLLAERGGAGRMFYRRRTVNTGKKAGNIEDFFQRSGAAYDYALILDADSLMEGATIAEMVRRMEADPELGLLQTLPKIIKARSRFGRAMQFAASFYSPIFARGQGLMQGRCGPFWGHNALVRVRAFAESCGLPVLSGNPPFGGHVLSHDYVEAALLARAGWRVRVDPDLEGSFEEGPENIIDYAKRDRRWCQGNLQHCRIIGAPGLRGWSRFVFLQGILAYIAPLFWLMFMMASVVQPLFQHAPNYFPEPYQLFPVFPSNETSKAIGLAIGVLGLLILPKLAIAAHAAMTGRARAFGGPGRVFLTTLWELAASSVMAPIMLMFQTRSVLQVLMGIDGGWPPNRRGDGTLGWGAAWTASRWIVLCGVLGLFTASRLAPELVLWLLPVCIPMILAPVVITLSSRPCGAWSGDAFIVPSETDPDRVILYQRQILDQWTSARDSRGAPAALGTASYA